ncbi:MAG: GNAT family N-acetyltransferase [Moorea sp. SIO3I7]|nr:GNAT family N-acetyltransferase [Moorena sp. SIO3I7]NEO59724.1 GNAT family N-acetyltransferase [Moorena sp. SIO4G2]
MITVLKRKVSKSEAELLVKAIKSTPNIIGYSLKEWLEAEHVIVSENEKGNLLGACLNYDINRDWYKIGALFVFKEFRGQGIGKSLFYKSVEDAVQRGKNVYTISSNPIVIKIIEDSEFEKVSKFFDLTKVWKEDRLFFFKHTVVWIMNLYRIKEIFRKTIVFNSNAPFVFGVKFSQ